MESFYGGRKGVSFVIVKRFDGLDIPQPNENGEYTYTGNYYAISRPGVFRVQVDPITRKPIGPIVKTEENQNQFTWEYHLNDGSNVDVAGAVQFPLQYAEGMKQCFEKGGETTSEVGYGEYVIIDTIFNLHNYSHIDNGRVFRRGMNYQGELGGAEEVGQIVGPKGDTPTIEMSTIEEIENNPNFTTEKYNSGSELYSIQNTGIVSGIDNDTIKYAWVEIKDDFGNTKGVQLGFTFPYTVIDLAAVRVDAYTDPAFTRVGDITKPYYYQWEVKIPEGVHGIDSSDIQLYDTPDGTRVRYKQTDYTTSGNGVSTWVDIGEYKTITDIVLAADGTLTVSYTYGPDKVFPKTIKWLDDVQIKTGTREGDGNQKIEIIYNDGTKTEIGNALNYIIESIVTDEVTAIQYNVEPYHLLVLYADPAKRGTVSYPSVVFNEVRDDWVDLGYIRGEVGGLHIIGNFDSVDSLKDADGNWLEPHLVEGWKEEYAGWCYTIGEEQVYVYDYINKVWYPFVLIVPTEPNQIIIVSPKSAAGGPVLGDLDLQPQGLWLVTEEVKYAN